MRTFLLLFLFIVATLFAFSVDAEPGTRGFTDRHAIVGSEEFSGEVFPGVAYVITEFRHEDAEICSATEVLELELADHQERLANFYKKYNDRKAENVVFAHQLPG